MRFQESLLLQKQQVELESRENRAQKLFESVHDAVKSYYEHVTTYRDPIAESTTRIALLQSRILAGANDTAGNNDSIISLGELGQSDSVKFTEEMKPTENGGKKEIVVRHLKEETNINPTTFKIYRKLRFT